MNTNYWGDPSEEDELPEWMSAKTYQNGGQPKRRGKSLEQIAEEVLKKPPIPVIMIKPDIE